MDVDEQDVRAIVDLHTRLADIDIAELMATSLGKPGACNSDISPNCCISDLLVNQTYILLMHWKKFKMLCQWRP